MVNTKLIFLLLFSISALTTSFATLAENSDCPPDAAPNSLCKQFKVRAVVTAKTIITGPKELTLERVGNVIQGETLPFTVKTNENAQEITVTFNRFPSPSGNMGLYHTSTGISNCAISNTHKHGFNLNIGIANNGSTEYQPFPNGKGMTVPFVPSDNKDKTASFKLKFTSASKFDEGLEVLESGDYSCDVILMLTVPA